MKQSQTDALAILATMQETLDAAKAAITAGQYGAAIDELAVLSGGQRVTTEILVDGSNFYGECVR